MSRGQSSVRSRRGSARLRRGEGGTSGRVRALADLIDIAAIEPDGLIVTRGGVYVRVIECEHVPNPVSADEHAAGVIQDGWAALCAGIPDHQGLSFYAQTDPIPITDAMREDHERVHAAISDDQAAGREGLARSRRRLLAAQTQSVIAAAGSEQPAVSARYWVAVPWRPEPSPLTQIRQALIPARGGVRTGRWEDHQHAARDSLRYTEQVAGRLAAMGIDPHFMGPVELLALCWERLHPAASELPALERFDAIARIVQATNPGAAIAQRREIIAAICEGPGAVGLDSSDRRWLEHRDGTLEEVLHLGTPPVSTSLWWLSHLLQVGLPCTVAVHIRVGDRARVRQAQRRRWRRLRAAVDYKDRRGRLVGSEEVDALTEAAELDCELAQTIAATVYSVSVYAAYRDPDASAERLEQTLSEVAKTFQSFTDARAVRGRFLNVPAWVSTLPLGVDELRATRSYAHRNIGHCVPLASADCGCPDGLIAGFSDPGGTLQRLDPFDPLFANHVSLVVGPSGGGKTVAVNSLLVGALSQGMRGYVIDRSSTLTEGGRSRTQGHYDALLSVIPGARRVPVGCTGGEVICPWDVPDPANVSREKLEALLALHGLLIGDQVGEERRLNADQEPELLRAACAVYERCARTGERPRETLLLQALAKREREPGLDSPHPGDTGAADGAPGPLCGGRAAGAHRRCADHRARGRAADPV